MHHRIYAAAKQQINAAAVLVEVPNALYVADNGSINVEQFLKLVDNECKWHRLR